MNIWNCAYEFTVTKSLAHTMTHPSKNREFSITFCNQERNSTFDLANQYDFHWAYFKEIDTQYDIDSLIKWNSSRFTFSFYFYSLRLLQSKKSVYAFLFVPIECYFVSIFLFGRRSIFVQIPFVHWIYNVDSDIFDGKCVCLFSPILKHFTGEEGRNSLVNVNVVVAMRRSGFLPLITCDSSNRSLYSV